MTALIPVVSKRADGNCYAFITFDRNCDIPEALDIFVRALRYAGYHEVRHDFLLEAINDRGFLDSGSISVRWKL